MAFQQAKLKMIGRMYHLWC